MSEEETKYGNDWTGGELDLIVADYFAILADELTGRPYAKAAHNTALRERIARSRGSVEFKYQNVSAVLEKLGMPWIPGYKPARHHQSAIVEVIAKYLASHPAALDMPRFRRRSRHLRTCSFLRRHPRSQTSNCPQPCGG